MMVTMKSLLASSNTVVCLVGDVNQDAYDAVKSVLPDMVVIRAHAPRASNPISRDTTEKHSGTCIWDSPDGIPLPSEIILVLNHSNNLDLDTCNDVLYSVANKKCVLFINPILDDDSYLSDLCYRECRSDILINEDMHIVGIRPADSANTSGYLFDVHCQVRNAILTIKSI